MGCGLAAPEQECEIARIVRVAAKPTHTRIHCGDSLRVATQGSAVAAFGWQLRVAPTFVLKYNIRTRSLADPGTIEDVLAVERVAARSVVAVKRGNARGANDVVPFDRADELASKQITRTGRAEAVTKEGLAATLLPPRQFPTGFSGPGHDRGRTGRRE